MCLFSLIQTDQLCLVASEVASSRPGGIYGALVAPSQHRGVSTANPQVYPPPPEVLHHPDTPRSPLGLSCQRRWLTRSSAPSLWPAPSSGPWWIRSTATFVFFLVTPVDSTRTHRCWQVFGLAVEPSRVSGVNITARPHQPNWPKVCRRGFKVTFETSAARRSIVCCRCWQIQDTASCFALQNKMQWPLFSPVNSLRF